MSAESRTVLRKDGILLTTATEERATAASSAKKGINLFAFAQRPSTTDVAVMTRQLTTLIKAGIPLFESYLRFAEALARCSPERASREGCVLVSFNLERVLGAGFTGGAASTLDAESMRRGGSHLHAEEHALLIAGAVEKDKLMFVTEAPCYLCAVRCPTDAMTMERFQVLERFATNVEKP